MRATERSLLNTSQEFDGFSYHVSWKDLCLISPKESHDDGDKAIF